jgi:glycosyltransferase involved in cell wall biosynthesis
MRDVSVIIPTYNRADSLAVTLQSLIDQTYPVEKFEIIVSDNHSTDDTPEVVQRFVHNPRGVAVRYLHEPRLGVHYARNSAALIANGELLYYTDDDVVAEPDMLIELVSVFDMDPQVASATGRVLPSWQVPPPAWVKKHCYNSLLSILDPEEDFLIAQHLPYIYSCHQAVRKDVLLEVGGFNPENTRGVWVGDGETGLVIKIEKSGYKFAFTGKSIIHHVIPPSRMTQTYLNKRVGNSGNCYAFTYFRQKRSSKMALLAEIIVLMAIKAPVRSLMYLGLSIFHWDTGYLRFIPAYWMYYFNRSRYNYRLATDLRLRDFVLRDNWFEDHEDLFPWSL